MKQKKAPVVNRSFGDFFLSCSHFELLRSLTLFLFANQN